MAKVTACVTFNSYGHYTHGCYFQKSTQNELKAQSYTGIALSLNQCKAWASGAATTVLVHGLRLLVPGPTNDLQMPCKNR